MARRNPTAAPDPVVLARLATARWWALARTGREDPADVAVALDRLEETGGEELPGRTPKERQLWSPAPAGGATARVYHLAMLMRLHARDGGSAAVALGAWMDAAGGFWKVPVGLVAQAIDAALADPALEAPWYALAAGYLLPRKTVVTALAHAVGEGVDEIPGEPDGTLARQAAYEWAGGNPKYPLARVRQAAADVWTYLVAEGAEGTYDDDQMDAYIAEASVAAAACGPTAPADLIDDARERYGLVGVADPEMTALFAASALALATSAAIGFGGYRGKAAAAKRAKIRALLVQHAPLPGGALGWLAAKAHRGGR